MTWRNIWFGFGFSHCGLSIMLDINNAYYRQGEILYQQCKIMVNIRNLTDMGEVIWYHHRRYDEKQCKIGPYVLETYSTTLLVIDKIPEKRTRILGGSFGG